MKLTEMYKESESGIIDIYIEHPEQNTDTAYTEICMTYSMEDDNIAYAQKCVYEAESDAVYSDYDPTEEELEFALKCAREAMEHTKWNYVNRLQHHYDATAAEYGTNMVFHNCQVCERPHYIMTPVVEGTDCITDTAFIKYLCPDCLNKESGNIRYSRRFRLYTFNNAKEMEW